MVDTKFSFKLIPKRRKIPINNDTKLTKLVLCVCQIIDGQYKAKVDLDNIDIGIKKKEILLDFTEESYNIEGVISVFSRVPEKDGKYMRWIRDEHKAKVHPGDPQKYTPFCHNWVCKGFIIKRGGKILFDFKECIAPKGYVVANMLDDELSNS